MFHQLPRCHLMRLQTLKKQELKCNQEVRGLHVAELSIRCGINTHRYSDSFRQSASQEEIPQASRNNPKRVLRNACKRREDPLCQRTFYPKPTQRGI